VLTVTFRSSDLDKRLRSAVRIDVDLRRSQEGAVDVQCFDDSWAASRYGSTSSILLAPASSQIAIELMTMNATASAAFPEPAGARIAQVERTKLQKIPRAVSSPLKLRAAGALILRICVRRERLRHSSANRLVWLLPAFWKNRAKLWNDRSTICTLANVTFGIARIAEHGLQIAEMPRCRAR
jgi:hypothetical protein